MRRLVKRRATIAMSAAMLIAAPTYAESGWYAIST
jgi:hypothetical protein